MVTADSAFWSGCPVLVTGHTGFKGSWLTMWLHRLGAEVHGFALDPPTSPSLFEVARVASLLTSEIRADVSHHRAIADAIESSRPHVVFHLAAQPLVSEGYRKPVETLITNVIGTARVLDAVRASNRPIAVVIVTTDKVYAPMDHPHVETDRLGGQDPYSVSKAAAELVTDAYRAKTFPAADGEFPRVATARAGNVVGGGDWATDRLLPDCVRAFERGMPIRLRHPTYVRPWQHVLEPLSGYLSLGERLASSGGAQFAGPWNFGPGEPGEATVAAVAEMVARTWGGDASISESDADADTGEATTVRLDVSKARSALDWVPRWSLTETIERTGEWYKAWFAGDDAQRITLDQISAYERADANRYADA